MMRVSHYPFQQAEQDLDLFNLNIAREQAELIIDRKRMKRVEDHEEQGWIAWALSWFIITERGSSLGSSSETEDDTTEPLTSESIVAQIEHAMTPDEQAKLYAAIDYQVIV